MFKKKKKFETILLDEKIDDFINWYYDNMVKGKYTKIGEYSEPKKMRHLIDRMSIWFELRYLNDNIDDNLINPDNNFNEEYKKYLKSLSLDEKWMLYDHSYSDIVYTNIKRRVTQPHFHLDSNGFVKIADYVELLNNSNIQFKEENFIGKHIKEVYDYLKKLKLDIDLREMKDTIENYENFEYMKQKFLDCVMYNIIERGGNRIGPKRGLIFAREFKRDINIPMKYGVDTSDPKLREFMNVYFKLGGSKTLECIDGYFNRDCDNYPFKTINMKEIIKITKYTEEDEKLQSFVNVIQSDEKNKVKKLVK